MTPGNKLFISVNAVVWRKQSCTAYVTVLYWICNTFPGQQISGSVTAEWAPKSRNLNPFDLVSEVAG
jgi:hypothetical protein